MQFHSINYNNRSQRGLEEWRHQAKLKQKEKVLEDEYAYTRAPFAIDTTQQPPSGSSDNRDGGGDEKGKEQGVQKFKTRLEKTREQIGIISNPSLELQEAERSLAEVGFLGLQGKVALIFYVISLFRPPRLYLWL